MNIILYNKKVRNRTPMFLPRARNVQPQSIGSQCWSYSPAVGWITPDGVITGEDGPWPFNKKNEKKGEQRFSDLDPYGEENWGE
jgi:hypothetical protein